MADETPITVKELKPGTFVMIEGAPCKVVGYTKSKPGKHGSAKARVECMGVFDNRRRYIMKPVTATVMSPIIDKKRAQIVSVDGNSAQLMDLEDYSTFETSIPEEFKGKLESGKEVVIWKIAGKVVIKELR